MFQPHTFFFLLSKSQTDANHYNKPFLAGCILFLFPVSYCFILHLKAEPVKVKEQEQGDMYPVSLCSCENSQSNMGGGWWWHCYIQPCTCTLLCFGTSVSCRVCWCEHGWRHSSTSKMDAGPTAHKRKGKSVLFKTKQQQCSALPQDRL